MKNKKLNGISLIVLVITIIVIIILAGSVILVLSKNNPIENARNAQFKSDLDTFKSELYLYEAKLYSDSNGEFDIKLLQADSEKVTYTGSENLVKATTIKDIITSMSSKYNDEICILNGQLLYKGTDENKKVLAQDMGLNLITSGNNNSSGSDNNIFGITDETMLNLYKNTTFPKTVDEFISNPDILKFVLSSEANIDYIITNKDIFMNKIVNSQIAMEAISSKSSVFDKFIANSDWTVAILNSMTAITALENTSPMTVPVMTSNTVPSGTAFASSEFSSSYRAYNAFDGSEVGESYWGVGSGLSYLNQYLGYDFGKTVWVYKIESFVTNGKQNTDYVIEASNNNSDWTIIKDGLHQTGNKITIIPNNYNTKYRYYRLRMLSSIPQSGSGNTVVYTLQFYAK